MHQILTMKFLVIIAAVCFSTTGLSAQQTLAKTSIEVNGNCNMCRKTIEKAARTDGVKKASWDVKTHELDLVYDSTKVSLDMIQLRIAAAGYDTPAHRANDATYSKLHSCCQYERKK